MSSTERPMSRNTTTRISSLLIALLFLIVAASAVRAGDPDCVTEPASQWAPAGFVCPPHYGIGTASTWGGPGAATNGCSHAIRDTTGCPLIGIRSLDTGLVVITRPVEWCMCWVGVTGPNGETERLVDLSPDLVAALGLPGPGLYDIETWPVDGAGFREAVSSATLLPNTSMGERP